MSAGRAVGHGSLTLGVGACDTTGNTLVLLQLQITLIQVLLLLIFVVIYIVFV